MEYQPTTETPPTIGIRPRELMREYGIGKHGLAILIEKEGHPKPIALGKRSSMFLRSEIDAWLASRIAQRDGS